jgi:hypothetical protein
MNEHLKPIFQTILPALEKAGIDYWVWGGIGIAGVKGFFRKEIPNNDVEVIVKDSDWEKTKEICQQVASTLGFRYSLHQKYHDGFKIDLYGGEKELFSVVPAFITETDIDFRYGKRFPLDFLDVRWREVEGYKFPSLKDEYLQKLLICYFERNLDKKDSKNWQKHMIDARGFLSEDQIQKF